MAVRLQLLGGTKVISHGEARRFTLDNPASLLVYLAVRGDWVSRAELAFLYRPDTPDSAGLGYLRKLVFRARRLSWAEGLEVTTDALRWCVDTDVTRFLAASEERRWQEAVDEYGGPFLAGSPALRAAGFSEWQEVERSALEARWLQAAAGRSAELEEEGRFKEAAQVLSTVLEVDPLAEDSLQAYMRALAADGRSREAIVAFENFRKALERELGAKPLEVTEALADNIRGSGSSGSRGFPPDRNSLLTQLPEPATLFVGREAELRRVGELLTQSRLVTIVGLGGSGKTRLAMEAARRAAGAYRDGTGFVSVADAADEPGVARTILEGLGVAREGDEPERILLDVLRERTLLLVLDNMEGALAAVPLLLEALQTAPGLTLLVTSREPLRASGEWLLDLTGLRTPPEGESRDLANYESVQLFVQRAARVSPHFMAAETEIEAVAQICRRLEGLPLAIELAASWVRLLSSQELLTELDNPSRLLTGEFHDFPERHLSLWRVFDYTWERLDEVERQALTTLTVFRGGFTLEAARQVANVDLELLLKLLDRTLVRRQGANRFSLHELVRQYALERGEYPAAAEAHSRYFCNRLASLAADLKGRDVHGGLAAVQQDFPNFELAWNTAVRLAHTGSLELAREALDYYFYYRARFVEAQEAFARAAEALGTIAEMHMGEERREALRVRGRLMLHQSQHLSGQGQLGPAEEVAQEALTILLEHGERVDVAYAQLLLANGLTRTASYAEAERLFRAVLKTAELEGEEYLIGSACNGLANVFSYTGETLDLAENYYRASLRAHRKLGNLEGISGALINLGACRYDLNDFDEAGRLWQEAADMAAELGYRQREAVLHNNLGSLAEARGDFSGAERCYRQSLELRRELGDSAGMANVLHNIGRLSHARGEFGMARKLLQEALELYLQVGEQAGIAHARSTLARTLAALGRDREAVEQAALALELSLAIESRSDVLSSLLTLALLHERQGRVREAQRIALAVSEAAAGNSEPLRVQAQQMMTRLGTEAEATPTSSAMEPGLLARAELESLQGGCGPSSPSLLNEP